MLINYESYGIDWEGPPPSPEWHESVESVEVPDTVIALSENDKLELVTAVDPLRGSDVNGIDIYLEVLDFLQQKLN